MLKLLPKLGAVLLLFGISVGLALLVRENSSAYQQCQSEQQAKQAAEHKPKGVAFLFQKFVAPYCTARFIEAHDDGITALSTVLLTFITGGLLWMAYLQIRTTRAELRAYVFVNETRLRGLDGRQRMSAISQVKNFGSTPAHRLQSCSELYVDRIPPAKTVPEEEKIVTADLGPGQFVGQTTTRKALTADELTAIRGREKAIYLSGVITYRDVFRRKQTTKFLFEMKASKRDGALHESVMALCDTGNEST